ncbi:family 78 glycoside hydrolase catalytic domain [Levilactobacillus brevis]|uniref:family 78 glycoside hydrolase catalytic domain n=1 Tax=Levilactobacillus brevis TaxID=1580 RepID=UPI001BDE59DA|nr:family 78 glycoside hydrolase catalytic domain [Levilactobacillus brevis]
MTSLEKTICPTHLRVNLLGFAYNVTKIPRFSWWDISQIADSWQTAYQIVVGNRLNDMANTHYVFDSGWKLSKNNSAVQVSGLSEYLVPGELYYWQVRIKDNHDNISDFSQPMKFICQNQLSTEKMYGIWKQKQPSIGGKLSERNTTIFFRSPKFKIKLSEVDSAIITAFSRGSEPLFIQGFDLNLNGKSVGVGSARPQPDYNGNPNKTGVYYNKFDVTEMLVDGNNVLSALVNAQDQRKAFWCALDVYTVAGQMKRITVTSQNWKVLDAAAAYGDYGARIRSIYFEMSPDNVDMNYYPQNWKTVNFDDSTWSPAWINPFPMISANEVLIPYRSESTRRLETHEPTKKIIQLGKADYLIDLGKEIIGSLKVNIECKTVQRCNVFMGEQLLDDGHVRHHLAAGPDYVENWILTPGKNKFETFQIKNFRYIELVGLDRIPDQNEVNGWTTIQKFDDREGEFESDNILLNREYELSKYTIKATNQDIFVDSQARERRPYEGDLLVNGLTSFAVSSYYSLNRHSLDYLIDNPTWPEDYKLFNVEMAWLDYLYTGDDDLLKNRYEDLKIKLNRGENKESFDGASQDFKGNLLNSRATDNFDDRVGLVTNNGLIDWPIPERDGFVEGKYNTPFNAIFYGAYQAMGKIAKVTGHLVDATYFDMRAKRIKKQMIARLYDPNIGCFLDSLNDDLSVNRHASHHASAYALCYGIYDSPRMADRLAAFVENDGKFIGSIYFIYFMLKGLFDSGHADKAIKLLTNSESTKGTRTFAAILDQLKATIAPEAWSNRNKENLTLSHPWGATPGLSIVQGIMGIVPVKPGFQEFNIRVRPGELKRLKIKTPSAMGMIEVEYQEKLSEKRLTVTIPMNARGNVLLPQNSEHVQIEQNNRILLENKNDSTVKLNSGKYVIRYI